MCKDTIFCKTTNTGKFLHISPPLCHAIRHPSTITAFLPSYPYRTTTFCVLRPAEEIVCTKYTPSGQAIVISCSAEVTEAYNAPVTEP